MWVAGDKHPHSLQAGSSSWEPSSTSNHILKLIKLMRQLVIYVIDLELRFTYCSE